MAQIKETSKSFHLSLSLSLRLGIDDVNDGTHITMASIESLIYCNDTVVISVSTAAIKPPFIRLRRIPCQPYGAACKTGRFYST